MALRISTPATPSDKDRQAVLATLIAHNTELAGPPNVRPVAVLLSDDDGQTVGGLWGRLIYDWLFVEFLALPPECRGRGFGSKLMAEAERIAREARCAGIWLDTFEFQARGFYEKLGFTVFGKIEDHPAGSRRYFMMKRLD